MAKNESQGIKRYQIFFGLFMLNIEQGVKDPDYYFSLFWRRLEIFKTKGHKTNIFELILFKRIIYRLGQ